MAASYYHPPSSSHYPSYYPPPPPPGAAAPLPQPSVTHPYPHHYHHHPQQPQYGIAYSHPPPPQLHGDEVRTLFIAGLPEDSKPREIYNLFREFPGYQSSQLRNSGKSYQAYAFAVFSDQQSAIAAMHALNGMIFDLEKESSLYVELAKSNSRTKHPRTDDEVLHYSHKRVRPVANSRGFPDSGSGSNIHMSGMGNSAYSLHGYPSAQSHENFDKEHVNDREPSELKSTAFLPQNNSACPTLFVANLGPTCSEQELAQAFSRCPGFLKLKMQNKYGVPVAFVDFQDVESSTAALNHLQGTFLYSSVGEGMRLEYAKSRMGLRKRQKRT